MSNAKQSNLCKYEISNSNTKKLPKKLRQKIVFHFFHLTASPYSKMYVCSKLPVFDPHPPLFVPARFTCTTPLNIHLL